MKRKHKLYVRPKKAYEKSRIKEENTLLNKYGLKNKREIWKTIAKVDYFRRRAKALAKSPAEEQEILFTKLKKIGLSTDSIADVLDLQVEDLLKRRLPSIILQKGYAKTAREARQMVAHKRVLIDGKIVNIPSYIVSLEEESKISIKPIRKKEPKVETKEAQPAQEQSKPAESKAMAQEAKKQ